MAQTAVRRPKIAMSLRLRLILLIVALVTVVVLVLSGVFLDSLVESLSAGALERSDLASQQVNAFISDHINRHASEHPVTAADPVAARPETTELERTKALWREIVSTDQDISAFLVRTMALSPEYLVEINVAGEDGNILASSNPSRVGQPLKQLEDFAHWRNGSLIRRLADVIMRKPDYQVVVPLGIAGGQPIFTTEVETSGVLLRNAVLPRLATGAVAATALLASLLLTGLATSRALRPLRR